MKVLLPSCVNVISVKEKNSSRVYSHRMQQPCSDSPAVRTKPYL